MSAIPIDGPPVRRRLIALATAGLLLAAGALAGCTNAAPSPDAAGPDAGKCDGLMGTSIPASAIGLPTTGGQVTAAKLVPADATDATAAPEYCRIDAALHPVDPKAPNIKLAVALPTKWNDETMMFGGGGYDGVIPGLDFGTWFLTGAPTPLSRGFVTYGSDSGHERKKDAAGKFLPSGFEASFAMNDEALHNYEGDALKKTHDAAMFLVKARYGKTPKHTYFAGGSTGGREALLVAQRWPEAFNGVISHAPAWNHGAILLDFGRLAKIFSRSGAFPNPAKQKLIYTTVMKTCDGLDGAKDGIISNQADCNLDPHVLRCPDGADTGDTCLSDAQISAMIEASKPMKLNYPLASGETGYAGWPFLSGGTITAENEGMNANPPKNPIAQTYDTMVYAPTWQEQVRHVITRDPNYDALTLDPENPGKWQQRISEISTKEDANNPDLSAFAKAGGKLLLIHGAADMWVSAASTEEYWNRVQTTMGAEAVKDFARFYKVPGFNHQSYDRGAPFILNWDAVTALKDWVEDGKAPQNVVASDDTSGANRTRPLCEYPTWPKYSGTGDVNRASSFTCVTKP